MILHFEQSGFEKVLCGLKKPKFKFIAATDKFKNVTCKRCLKIIENAKKGDKNCDFDYLGNADYGFYPCKCKTHNIIFGLGDDGTQDLCLATRLRNRITED